MLSAQQLYAPDPNSAASWNDGTHAMGRRLTRLFREDQFDRGPIVGGDGRSVLVADVRLDNRDELRLKLGISQPDAREMADSALVMAAFERWQENAVDALRGDFALAFWDSGNERLILARDFSGQRPLHFHRGSDFFAIASMPKGLHALPEIPRAPDQEALERFLALVPETGSHSFFRGVERVLPGHICTVTRGTVISRPYWNPSRAPLLLKSSADYEEAVREKLDRAVVARLRDAERVGAHLSGGLDSSAVVATAARLLDGSGKVVAFTAVPREGYDGPVPFGRFGDEGELAAAVAESYRNIEHVLIRSGSKSPVAGLDRNFFLYDRPVLNPANMVWGDAILEAARQRKLGVMLCGQMGNMSFSYAGLESLPEMLLQGRLVTLARQFRRLPGNGIRLESVLAHTIGPFLSPALWRLINRWRGRHLRLEDYSAVSPGAAQTLHAKASAAGLDFSYRTRKDPFGTRLWALRNLDLGNYYKGFLGGWGIDMRDPTGDRDLVELCLAIPADQYLHEGLPRSLARRAFRDRLPASILTERRKGLQAIDWHEGLDAARSEVRQEFDRIASVPDAAAVLDTSKLAALLDDWPQGGWNGNKTMGSYRLALLRGISGGHFIRKATGSNA